MTHEIIYTYLYKYPIPWNAQPVWQQRQSCLQLQLTYLYIQVHCKSAAIRNKTFLHNLIQHNWTGNTEEMWLTEARGI